MAGRSRRSTRWLESRLRDFELVVVDRRVERTSHVPIVEDWIAAHPRIAARLVVTEATGAGAARNIGLDFARGRRSF